MILKFSPFFFKDFDSYLSIFTIFLFFFLLILDHSSSFNNHPLQQINKYSHQNPEIKKYFQVNQETMKVHPMPKKRNNITIQYPSSVSGTHYSSKKLRRLPHIFSRVLELPFKSDADVSVEESSECFRFVAETTADCNIIGEVRAHTIEIHPGVTKIVIRPNGYLELSSFDDLELDMWRFRLPDSTRPELASAVLTDGGELIVTVPKGDDDVDDGEFKGGMGNNNNNYNARLVLVQ